MHNIDLPIEFQSRLSEILNEEDFTQVLNSFSIKKPVTFRLNHLKNSDKQLAERLQAKPVENFANAYHIDHEAKEMLSHSEAFNNGEIYIQSLSSMLAPIILDPQPGEEILDLTAAPGSKTTQIADMMCNQGRIAAVEKVKSRFFKLKDNCERQGVTIADFYCKDGATVWRSCENRFDRVLLDAPCSSEGRFNLHNANSFRYWSERKIREMTRKQWPLLLSAFRSLKPGGIMVYSTCTFAIEENEAQIKKLMKKFGDQAIIESIKLPFNNIRPGRDPINQAIRILPDEIMDGFFICRIRKA